MLKSKTIQECSNLKTAQNLKTLKACLKNDVLIKKSVIELSSLPFGGGRGGSRDKSKGAALFYQNMFLRFSVFIARQTDTAGCRVA